MKAFIRFLAEYHSHSSLKQNMYFGPFLPALAVRDFYSAPLFLFD